MKLQLTPKMMACLALTAALAGCGGGSGSGSSGSGGSTTLTGTAATGAALANASVAITDSSGNSPCQEATITTTALGSYTCTLKSGETAPFFIVVTDPTGNTAPLVSVATSTPAAGSALTVNATPLTTAILAQMSSDGNALTLVSSRSINAGTLATLTANVVAQLNSVLSSIGAPAGYDPFATSITAATASGTGNTADLVLDVVKVVTNVDGKLALSTVGSTAPLLLATTTTQGTALAAPTYSVSDLSQAAQLTAQSLNTCFALPSAQRALTTDITIAASQGGPSVTSLGSACQNIFADSTNAAGIDFKHNGYSAGQYLYGILTSDTMTGAQFSVPEIMLYRSAANTASGVDEAVLNIRYLDAGGNPGNITTVARNVANGQSTAHPSHWWLVGNQDPADVAVKLQIRRVEQLNPAVASGAGNAISTFQTGISFNINAVGPGSTNNTLGSLTLARVTGPGLESGGLVFIAPIQSGQTNMDLYNKTGNLAAGARCGNSSNQTFNCPNLWFARTAGTTGAAATTLASNQSGLSWVAANDGADPTLVVKGQKYQIELFYGTDTTNPVIFKKTLLTDLVQATQAANLPWNTPGPKTLSALDPNGSLTGAQTNLTVDWIQNSAAQQINGVQAVVDSSGGYGPMSFVSVGSTSGVLSTAVVPAFSASTSRNVLFRYRMLDDSSKSSVYRYN